MGTDHLVNFKLLLLALVEARTQAGRLQSRGTQLLEVLASRALGRLSKKNEKSRDASGTPYT